MSPTNGDPVLKVALYGGVALERDAISNSFMAKLELLTRLAEEGHPVEVCGFVQGSDYQHPALTVVPGLAPLLRHPGFQAAGLHLFEFGMPYELFNALYLVDGPSVVVDHNTTPPELVDLPETKAACQRSLEERNSLWLATHVATDSEFTRDELVAKGYPADRVTVLHLPAENARGEHRRRATLRKGPDQHLKLLYVGRFVRAKGVIELLRALEELWESGVGPISVTVAGSRRFSDPETLIELERFVATHQVVSGRLSLVLDASDSEVADLYQQADVMVMPSHHEGYCVPVIEALHSGCYVIGSDAGNVPNVVGGLGTIVPTGDVGRLAQAIATYLEAVTAAGPDEVVVPTDEGPMTESAWQERVAEHLRAYTHEHYERTLLAIMAAVLTERPEGAPDWLVRLADDGAALAR